MAVSTRWTEDQVGQRIKSNASSASPPPMCAVWEQQFPTNRSTPSVTRPGPERRSRFTTERRSPLCNGALPLSGCSDSRGVVHDLETEYDVRMPIEQITTSPLIYQDLVIQIAAGKGDACVVAFDRETGKERWRAIDERSGIQFADFDQTR